MKARHLALGAVLAAILLTAQVVLAFLPNIELVTFLIILYTIHFKPRITLCATAVFVLLEGVLYGFGIWWLSWVYIWPILVLISYLMRRNTSLIIWCVVTGSFGLLFGALCAIPYLITGGIWAAVSYWFAGIPFDVAHCLGNIIAMLLLYKPIGKCFAALAIPFAIGKADDTVL